MKGRAKGFFETGLYHLNPPKISPRQRSIKKIRSLFLTCFFQTGWLYAISGVALGCFKPLSYQMISQGT